MAARLVKVSVAGNTLSIRTDAKAKYVKELAAYVSEKMSELNRAGRSQSTQSMALLAAMNIADELFQQRQEQEQLKRKVKEKAAKILRQLEREAEHYES